MESASDKLFKGFVELCEQLVAEAYVITDGRQVLTAVLDHSVATKLCKVMIDRTGEESWKVAKIADALELAYRSGYNTACQDFEEQMKNTGDQNEQTQELRDSDIQREEQ